MIWGLFANRFTAADTAETATVLAYLCLGLGGWAAQSLIARGFYALGSTWLPTIVGTMIAAVAVPLYVLLRRQDGAIGLAIASSVAITVYVAVLGLLQRRRFELEAAAQGTTLNDTRGMLGAVLRMAAAAILASALGLWLRGPILQWLPGMTLAPVLLRAVLLCGFGVGLYVALVYLFGVQDVAELKTVLAHRLHDRRHLVEHEH
jgi:putative peptidoglycan lipid II flippase